MHYRDEAFKNILYAAIHLREIKVAKDVTERWRKTGEDISDAVVDAWFEDGQYDEASAAARRIEDPDHRVSSLLLLAENILSKAGAPFF